MTELMRQLAARKQERRKQLADLPVGEKLRMLEEMVAATQAISATRPQKNGSTDGTPASAVARLRKNPRA
jgi:hypothetical protein